MTAMTRNFPVLPALDPGTVSPQIAGFGIFSAPISGAWAAQYAPRSPAASIGVVSVYGGDYAMLRNAMFDRQWKNTVHVIPNSVELGFILSEVTRDLELFNNYEHAQVLGSVSFQNGGVGMYVETGPAPPAHFATGQAYGYTLRVTTEGAPQINDAALFNFTSITVTLAIEGSRLVPFTISPDWSDGIVEGVSYLTDVMRAYNTTEQRVQLRGRPRRMLKFTALALDARESALLHAMMYDWQARAFGVPVWQDIAQPAADIAIGAASVAVDTTGRQYEVGGLAFVWRNPHEWEAYQVDSVSAGSIGLVSPSQQAWTRASGAYIMPMRIGRITDSETLTRLAQEVAEARLSFIIDGVLQ